jgi:hypothetical protein
MHPDGWVIELAAYVEAAAAAALGDAAMVPGFLRVFCGLRQLSR